MSITHATSEDILPWINNKLATNQHGVLTTTTTIQHQKTLTTLTVFFANNRMFSNFVDIIYVRKRFPVQFPCSFKLLSYRNCISVHMQMVSSTHAHITQYNTYAANFWFSKIFWRLERDESQISDCKITRQETLSAHWEDCMYRVRQNITPQHENRNFSEVRKYFCTKFCSFVQHITVHESVVSCCIYLT